MNKIVKIKISEIDDFKNHPYRVELCYDLNTLVESIKLNGLLAPIVVRRKEDNRYEMLSGHRREKAYEILVLKEIDTIIKDLNDDEAAIFMVDSSMYREKLLPSEKAFFYKIKIDALKHQGKTLGHYDTKLRSYEKIAKNSNDSARQIQRYIRLTYLIPELLEIVDNSGKLKDKPNLTMRLLPAVELSFLSKHEQQIVYLAITYEDVTPSHGQAIRIRKLSSKKLLTFDGIDKILLEEKGNQHEKISFNLAKRDKRYIEQYIIEAIKMYKAIKNTDTNI